MELDVTYQYWLVVILILEQSLLVFWKIVELNSTAFVQEPLKIVALQFADLFLILHALDGSEALHQSRDYLDKLHIGLSLPAVTKTAKQHVNHQPVAFVAQREPPGGRHDNDDADICKIKIMPTLQEILSPRSEYLPLKDPRQWHVCGLAGLLDRNFRLLREDTIGWLRDAIHEEMQPVDRRQRSRQKGETRTHVYRQAVVQGVDFHRFDGLQFLVHFSQPTNVRGAAKKKLQEWWQLSKHLQTDALAKIRCPQKQQEKLAGSLSDDPIVASVLLKLVESGESSWQYMLDCHASQHNPSSISLVEFPAGDVPMAEFVAPQDQNTLSILADVPQPVYAASQNFSFDRKCLMKDRSSLQQHSSRPFELEKLQDGSTLDDAQALALASTLQHKNGLIQGPPGTGKSFTGVTLIKVLLANKVKVKRRLGPIVCVCYTNHALDQLLEDLLDNGITSQIIRVGSQSKSERLQPLNLRNVVRGVEKTCMEKTEQWHLHTAF
ncbi:hypothetical protein BDW60DRAFT_207131 [Aspergillus nidulans var. acristatus]